MTNLNLAELKVSEMSASDMEKTDGGWLLAAAAIVVGYCCWAASFCYQLGKD